MFILTIHYNHLFFVWLIMNCVDYQPNKKCPYINSPFYEITIIIAQAKLSAKTVFNRQALQAVQDELPKYLNERGFELERGEKGSERKNLTVPEYKKAKDELKEITTTLEQRKSEVLALSNDKAIASKMLV